MFYHLTLIIVAIMCVLVTQVATLPAVPVVYVLFGAPPTYMQLNIELALRHNPVIILSDSVAHVKSDNGAVYVDMLPYKAGALKFEYIYKHMSKDLSRARKSYELQCFLRWYFLRDYMEANNIERVFFGDGDAAVFTNMTKAYQHRVNCSAVINVESQSDFHHWVAAGESSLWTLEGISAFCEFNSALYDYHSGTLELKHRAGSTVTDMSALWLWWVATHRTTLDWATGRPYQPFHCERSYSKNYCQLQRNRYDAAFNYAKQLHYPLQGIKVNVCNGLDVVRRTTFDHMHGWNSGNQFSFNLETNGVPSFLGTNSLTGGTPETLDEKELKKLEKVPVSMLTLHYQGTAKEYLQYDICRVLLLTGSKVIISPTVAKICEDTRNSTGTWPKCRAHVLDSFNVCV